MCGVCLCVYVCLCLCVSTYVYTCACVCVSLCMHACMRVCLSLCMRVCVCLKFTLVHMFNNSQIVIILLWLLIGQNSYCCYLML